MGFLAAVGGWFLVPMGVGAATRIATTLAMPNLSNADPRLLALFGAAQAGSAYACYKLADKAPQGSGKRSFLRGGMWGSGFGAVGDALVAGVAKEAQGTTSASATGTSAASQQLVSLHQKLFQGGFFKP